MNVRALLASACLFACLAEAAAAPAPVNKWLLWSGPGVKLRGANVFQRRSYPELDHGFIGSGTFGPPMTQNDFDRLAALGANFVNLSVPGVYSENPPYALDLVAQSNLDDLIAMASRANLYVVIAFRTGPGRSEAAFGYLPAAYDNEAVWTSQAAQDAWVEMWTTTALHYKSNSAVVGYDLMVEPNSNEILFDEFDPVAFYAAHGGTLADWNQLHPRISAAIRSVDSDTPVLTEAMNYGSVDWLGYVTVTLDAKTVYAVHYYEPFAYTHQDPPDLSRTYPGSFDESWLRSSLMPIDIFKANHAGKPVTVNEFGVKRWEPGAERYFADVTAILEDKGVNRAIWLWSDSYPEDQTADDFNFRNGPDPSNHTEVTTSPLFQAVVADFARNGSSCAAIDMQPPSLPSASVGKPYEASLTGIGGIPPYTFTAASTLPRGIVFTNGTFSGTPIDSGAFSIVITARDAKGCSGTRSYTLVVVPEGSERRRAIRHG